MATNQPNKVNRNEVIPGISDHDIPLIEIDVSPIKRRQPPRNIALYSKAKWENIREELEEIGTKIKEESNTKSANHLWNMFKDTILDAIKKHIPMKTCKAKESLPYMTTEIKKLIRRRDRAYKNRKRCQKNFQTSSAGYKSLDQKVKEMKREI